MLTERINVDKPLWDQSSFYGRFKHFVWLTSPVNCFHSPNDFYKAKKLIEDYKAHKTPPGTDKKQILHSLRLYKSAFHPDSGELQNVFGRMSFQVPGGLLITSAMLHFYKTVPQVMFWQWFNQSFNALVNYTNRNANSHVSPKQLVTAYILATTCALGTAVGLNKHFGSRSSPIFKRLVPFVAVASSNFVNIPLMRFVELTEGIDLKESETGVNVCKSKAAAALGISCVVLSRITIAAPGMIFLPFVMERMEKKEWFLKRKFLHIPFQGFGIGLILCVMVPFGCALFPQTITISKNTLEKYDPTAYKSIKDTNINQLEFNKGL
ncbi:sideroflexin-2 [Lepeophtheirus salmonis]|uniref:Sidoreflexin n=1 Tax=Lepeophtheirus salmonis TaxID=72036 RepID=A0A0K2UMQ6_LEPSM|nr:sideroflexin-2-like [Lepeophtheirus salmonis]